MSRLEWFILFIAFVAYVLIGGAILYAVESEAEAVKHAELLAERREIQELVRRELENGSLERTHVLEKLAEYCGKPVMFAPNNTEEQPLKIWNFYNAFFVAVTIVSSIGYGNMAPTTVGTRMFCIVYALIGIPFNGILLAGMGEYFSRTFLRAHHRYKEAPEERSRMSLFLKVLQYLAMGIGIFILLPAVVFVYAEEWYYDEAVYYAFVTLSTIGFGDYVAGYMTKYDTWKQSPSALVAYRTFIVLWILFGLGYLAMILSFITRALRSSRIRRLEHRMAKRFKSTHAKLWQNASKDIRYLRRVLNELYMLKFKVRLQNQNQSRLDRLYRAANAAAAANNSKNAAKNATSTTLISTDSDSLAANNNNNSFSPLEQVDILQSLNLARHIGNRDDIDWHWHVQPVYRATRQSLVPTSMRERSNSLPGRLPSQLPEEEEDAKRRRFDSEGPAMGIALPRTVSESCLDMIDRGATFAAAPKRVDTNELLATVVDALASAAASDDEEEEGGVHGFSDAEILSSEGQPSLRSRASSIAQSLRSVARSRAGSVAQSFRSRAGSVAAGGRTPPEWEDVEAAKRNAIKSKGKESPISLRKALAMRSAERDFAEASSVTASPIPRRLLPNMDRRSSDGAVMVTPPRMRAASLAPGLAGLHPLHQLDDTTVGDLLRALHSLHSRVETTPLSEEARVTYSRRGSQQDEEPRHSRRGSRLDSSPSSRQLAQQLLDRLENGHVTRDVTAGQRDAPRDGTPRGTRDGTNGARIEGRPRDSRSGSRDSTNGKRDVPKSQRETSTTSRDVLSRAEPGRRSRSRTPASTILEESSPSQEELPSIVDGTSEDKKKTGSDSDSEKSIIISRL